MSRTFSRYTLAHSYNLHFSSLQAVVYLDLRVKKEGLTASQLGEDLGLGTVQNHRTVDIQKNGKTDAEMEKEVELIKPSEGTMA